MNCRPDDWPGQLTSDDPNGDVNCAAYALAKGLEFNSCGGIRITGARVRQLTNEPVPDPRSPGLHHGQLRDVAAKFGVTARVIQGAAWSEVTDLSEAGHAILVAVNYYPIRTTIYSGQRTFYGNHELLLLPEQFIYDSLADGRMSNGRRVFRGPAQYPESLIKAAAGAFVTARYPSGAVKSRLGLGRANILVLPARHPLIPSVPTTGPRLVLNAPKPQEINVAITAAYDGYKFRMVKGQPIFRHPGGPIVTRLAKAGALEYNGKAGKGWVIVKVNTKALYEDGIVRPSRLYVPQEAGVLE